MSPCTSDASSQRSGYSRSWWIDRSTACPPRRGRWQTCLGSADIILASSGGALDPPQQIMESRNDFPFLHSIIRNLNLFRISNFELPPPCARLIERSAIVPPCWHSRESAGGTASVGSDDNEWRIALRQLEPPFAAKPARPDEIRSPAHAPHRSSAESSRKADRHQKITVRASGRPRCDRDADPGRRAQLDPWDTTP